MAIVGPQFCAPYPIELGIVRKLMTIPDGNFAVTDANGNLLFKVKEPLFSLSDKRVLLDASDTPILTLRENKVSLHDRWQVFRGKSTDQNDLVYTLKRSSMIQILKPKLDIFLAQNKEMKICDFHVKGSWIDRSCTVYAGKSDGPIVAQMHKKHTAQSIILGKSNFSVSVFPNVDFAFIVSLIVILDDINKEDSED
ncbi:unnamed protein product [Microthlaspi erraticum]|uniref:Protein LURP-one-related 15 n=1 Tax=Microthlaspi erraticum TaxID=1685480 RepID=A0A6D2HL71_9BRAS|nr:unnamed protein product [Microthlaspi erraticum]